MKILVAEDHMDTAIVYKNALDDRGHIVIITSNGEDCLRIYNDELQTIALHTDATEHIQPFDAVILDYKMPKMNGLEVAKEILAVKPRQRIIFASAYIKDTLFESIQQLNQIVEILNKPFSQQDLIDTIEDREIYSEIKKLEKDLNIDAIRNANFRHQQLRDILHILRKKKR